MYRNGIKNYNCLGNVINQQTKSPLDSNLITPNRMTFCYCLQNVVGMTSWWERPLFKPVNILLCGGTCSLTRLKEVISEISHLSKTILFII